MMVCLRKACGQHNILADYDADDGKTIYYYY